MPTYEYECDRCGVRFERKQGISEAPLMECPECRGSVRRLISGGGGFIMKGAGSSRAARHGEDCSLARTGRTCCGRGERCDDSPCSGGR
ncbi:MAG: zinc ribbon domain-containing protein [Syntrophaceae bacterium]|nr:zinc ribbon domain-containing protein [Syntrophaceae bacterium]